MPTEELKDKTEDLFNHAGDYLDTFYKLTIVTATEKATEAASAVVSIVAYIVIGFFIVFFAGFGLAWWLGDLLHSRIAGFFITAGFFLLILVIVLLLRKKLIFPAIHNSIINKVYDEAN